jgi:hypothetical protein
MTNKAKKADRVPVDEVKAETTEHTFDFKPIAYHEWRQEGDHLICSSCVHPHSAHIGPGKILGKDDDGNFTLRTTEEDAKARQIA